MDLRQLRSALVIAETGSLNAAARRLRIAQPALSRQIRLLEEELGTAIFARHARGMTLTEAGELLLERARRALREIDQARSDLSALSGQVTGQVAIGLLPSVSELMAARFVRAMREKYPLVRLRIITGLAAHILEWLEVRDVHHHEQCLLERIRDRGGLREEPIEQELELLRDGERLIHRSGNRNLDPAKPSSGRRIREQIVGQQRMQVADRVAIEPHVVDVLDEHLDRRLVVEDHLRLALVLARSAAAELDQILGVEPCIGVAFEPARRP